MSAHGYILSASFRTIRGVQLEIINWFITLYILFKIFIDTRASSLKNKMKCKMMLIYSH